MHTAITLDGHLKSALAAVRALGVRGVPVVAGAERRTAMALGSRYVSERFVYPDPKTDPSAFKTALTAQVTEVYEKTGQPVVVYSFSDATTLLISELYEQLQSMLLFPLPDPDSFATAFDKTKTAALALELGIPTMPSLEYDERHVHSYPVVIKPRHSVVWQGGQGVSGTAEFIFSPQALKQRYETIESKTGEVPLIQSVVAGSEYGVELLCADGEVLRAFTHRRIRSLSPRGGAAVVKETATASDAVATMERYAHQLARELRWTGPMMVEFKIDGSDSTVRLMEINGRFWGSLPLPQAAGVDFVFTYYEWLTKGTVSAGPTEPPHRRTYHFLGDCKWLLSVLFARDQMRAQLYPSRLEALRDFAVEPLKGRSDVFSVTDPLPSWYEVFDMLQRR